MKWVKVAIGAVIAIAVVPMIALSVFNLTQGKVKEEVVTFEVLTETTVTQGTYNKITVFESDASDDYKLDVYVNDVLIGGGNYTQDYDGPDSIGLFIDGTGESLYIYSDDTIFISDYPFIVGDIVTIVGEVTQPPVLSGVTATLLLLAPVIFAGGVLAYLLNKQNY